MVSLPVFYEKRPVGTIEADAAGPQFTYSEEWAQTRGAFPISTAMPIAERVIEPARLLPWIANLIPEGNQLAAVSQNLHVSPQDVIAILSEIGRDTAGALSFKGRGSSTREWKKVSDANALERIIEELPSKPFLVGEDGISMSLAGAQSKLGVAVDDDGQIYIPINGSPSTHILKPDIPRLFGSVANEALCLVLARRCKLQVPRVSTGKAGSREYFLIERYDRQRHGELWRRIHQEDFCQALGRFPASKYQKNQSGVPGPDIPEMVELVRTTLGPAGVIQFLDYLIFNVVCCNTDAHSKNYSLIIRGGGARLAPIYDVMCSAIWPNVTKNLANTIGKKNRGDYIKGRHWQREASACGLNPKLMLSRVEAMAKRVIAEVDAAMEEVAKMPAGEHPMLQECGREIAQRAAYVISGLSELEEMPDETMDEDTGSTFDVFAR